MPSSLSLQLIVNDLLFVALIVLPSHPPSNTPQSISQSVYPSQSSISSILNGQQPS